MDLHRHSIEVILGNQAPSGAFVACPSFPTYNYCWFRDGAYTAYALDLHGEHAAAARFFDWSASAILSREAVVKEVLRKTSAGLPLAPHDTLHTRYRLDGRDALEQDWPNFQLDGFGTWLWALGRHERLSARPLPERCRAAAILVGEYLAALWSQPCYDCWEEFGDKHHPATLAAIFGGLSALHDLTGTDCGAVQAGIRATIERDCVYHGYFTKFAGSYTVDASLLALATPYNVFPLDDPRVNATVARIEASLAQGGGVHRYPTDTYYGGGEWLLLACWLGWHHVRAGNRQRAAELLAWTGAQARPNGDLPEQVARHLNDPNYLKPWEELWGESASPLLWSHAAYLILEKTLATG